MSKRTARICSVRFASPRAGSSPGASTSSTRSCLPLAFNAAVSEADRAEEERVQEAVNRFFILPIFVRLGLTIPWEGWLELGWKGLLLTLAALLLRRLPAMLALKPLLGRVRGTRDALFLGWFGPIGFAALYYANLSLLARRG